MFDAVNFAENAAFSQRHASEYLSRCKDYFKWKEYEEILEVGCADGKLTKTVLYPFVEKNLGHLYGVDCDGNAIDIAKKLYTTEQLSFAKMDAEDSQYASIHQNTFDHIFAFYALHWVSLSRWPNNFFKMMKHGGQLFASIFLSPNPLTLTMQKLKTKTCKPWWKYLDAYQSPFQDLGSAPIHTITTNLSNAGFVVNIIEVVYGNFEFHTEAMISGDSNIFMPEEIYNEYFKDFLEEIKLFVKTNENGFSFENKVLIFVASKP